MEMPMRRRKKQKGWPMGGRPYYSDDAMELQFVTGQPISGKRATGKNIAKNIGEGYNGNY